MAFLFLKVEMRLGVVVARRYLPGCAHGWIYNISFGSLYNGVREVPESWMQTASEYAALVVRYQQSRPKLSEEWNYAREAKEKP